MRPLYFINFKLRQTFWKGWPWRLPFKPEKEVMNRSFGCSNVQDSPIVRYRDCGG